MRTKIKVELVEGEIARLKSEPGDKYVVNVPFRIPDAHVRAIGAAVARWLGCPQGDVLVCTDGIQLGVLKPEAQADAEPAQAV